MRPLPLLTAALCCFAPSAQAADPALIAAAKKEGTVVWYTTQIVDQFARPAAAAFERLYPGIKVRLSRTNATTAAIKILQENRAGKNQSDVFDGTVTVVPLKKEGYVLKWLPDAAKSLKMARNLTPISNGVLELQQCPECQTYYLYRTNYEYLVYGSEDEQFLQRLADEAAAKYLEGAGDQVR